MSDPSLDALTKITGQEFRRAGIGREPRRYALDMMFDSPYAIGEEPDPFSIMNSGQDDSYTPVDDFRALLLSGDPDTDPKELSPMLRATRNRQLKDFEGRGWSRDEVAEYQAKTGGVLPPMLLSKGSQQADSWRNNREFVDRHFELEGMGEGKPKWVAQRVRDLQADNAKNWQGKVGREHGESGWSGFLENPEYTVGYLMNNLLDPGYNAYSYTMHQGTGKERGGAYQSAVNDPAAYRDIKNAANKVSPVLPGNPQTPLEKEQQYKRLKQLAEDAGPRYKFGPTSYEAYYRQKYGEYPSYGGSTVHEFLQNLIDPTTILGAGAAAKSGLKAVGKSVLRELLTEEVPMAAAIGGGMTAWNEHQKTKTPETKGTMIDWGELFTPGVRPDLPDQNQTDFLSTKRKADEARVKALNEIKDVTKSVQENTQRPKRDWSYVN